MDKQPRIKLYSAVIDCADPDALAAFYAQLMDWLVVFSTEEYVVVGAPGMPQGGYPGLTFQRDPDYVPPVWPGKPGDQQTMEHLDFAVDDLPAAVARAVSLGARVADEQFTQDWTVMLDPEGHPFCLLNMQAVMQSEGFALR